MRTYKYLSIAIMTGFVVTPAISAEGLYVEGLVGSFDAEAKTLDAPASNLDLATIGIRGGYLFHENFSIEGEVQTGLDEQEFADAAFISDVGLHSSAALFARASTSVTERFDVHARLGVASTEFETNGNFIDTYEGPAYGIGGTLNLSEKLYVRGDLTQYGSDDVESESVSLSLGWRF